MTQRTGRRRGLKSMLVEPYKQVKLGLMFLIVNGIFAALILAVYGYFILDIYSVMSTYFKLSHAENSIAMAKFSWPIIGGILIIVLFVITTLVVSIRYTHEIYGPLVSIHRFVDGLLAGVKPTALHLRESDQLKDLATKLNHLGDTMTDKDSRDPNSGPFIAIHRFLDDLIAGCEPRQLQLRESDQFGELVVKLNELSRRLYQKPDGSKN